KRIKQVLNENIPDEIDETLENINQLRNTLSGDFSDKVRQLNQVTAGLVANKKASKISAKTIKLIIWAIGLVFVATLIWVLWNQDPDFREYVSGINPEFYKFLIAGFIFAMIDGAIGMSYGVTTTTFSLSMGIPPASASTGVH